MYFSLFGLFHFPTINKIFFQKKKKKKKLEREKKKNLSCGEKSPQESFPEI